MLFQHCFYGIAEPLRLRVGFSIAWVPLQVTTALAPRFGKLVLRQMLNMKLVLAQQ
jgi:hypothetical protein